jgi:hypothetical protein
MAVAGTLKSLLQIFYMPLVGTTIGWIERPEDLEIYGRGPWIAPRTYQSGIFAWLGVVKIITFTTLMLLGLETFELHPCLCPTAGSDEKWLLRNLEANSSF